MILTQVNSRAATGRTVEYHEGTAWQTADCLGELNIFVMDQCALFVFQEVFK